MADKEKLEIPAVPEVQRMTTEKFAVNKSEVDVPVEIGDFVDVHLRGEVVEFQDGGTIIILRKTGKARAEGDVQSSTVEEMRNSLPKADK